MPRGPRSKKALQGADLLIYLGHGNGYPSPYAPFRASSKNGLGLNSSAGRGNSNLKYYGESLPHQLRPDERPTRWSSSTTCATRPGTPSRGGRIEQERREAAHRQLRGRLPAHPAPGCRLRGAAGAIPPSCGTCSSRPRRCARSSGTPPQAKHSYSFTFSSTRPQGRDGDLRPVLADQVLPLRRRVPRHQGDDRAVAR